MFVGNKSFADLIGKMDFTSWQKEEEEAILSYITKQGGHYPYRLEKELQAAISQCDFERIDDLTKEFGHYPAANLCKNNPLRSKKNNIICNCTLLTRVALEAGVSEKRAYALSDMYINKTEELVDIEALNDYNRLMYVDYIYQIKQVISQRHVYSDITNKAITYIQHHLGESITLEKLSKDIGVNRSYLSRLFKKEVCLTFTDYIHKCRIERAKNDLLFTDMPLAHIAQRLGYSSQSHFTKSFKQYMGQSPHDFQRNFSSAR